jgi:hypothetical protein
MNASATPGRIVLVLLIFVSLATFMLIDALHQLRHAARPRPRTLAVAHNSVKAPPLARSPSAAVTLSDRSTTSSGPPKRSFR